MLRSTLFWVEKIASTSRYPSVNRLASKNLRMRRRCLNSSGGADGRSPTGSAPGITVDSRSVRLACRIATLPLGSPPAYMLRRYCPPTSNSAWVICPSEHTRTVFTSSANTLPLSITTCFSFASAAGASCACR